MFAKISTLCCFLTGALLVWSGVCILWSEEDRQDENALAVEAAERSLGEQTVGTHVLELHVRNTSSQSRRIIGMTDH